MGHVLIVSVLRTSPGGTCDPACGSLPGWFQFEADLTLFNVFKGHFTFHWTKNEADNPTDGLTTTESTVAGAVFLDVGKMKEKLKEKIKALMGLTSHITTLQNLPMRWTLIRCARNTRQRPLQRAEERWRAVH